MRILLGGSVFRSEWSGGEPLMAKTCLEGFEQRGHQVRAVIEPPTGFALASMAASPVDWDPVRVARYAGSIRQFRPDVALCFYDYDSSLCVAAHRVGLPIAVAVHIHWPLCPIGTLYIDGSGVCPGPSRTRCLHHMDVGVPDARLPLQLQRLAPPLGALVYSKFSHRHRVLSTATAIIAVSDSMAAELRAAGYLRVTVVRDGIELTEAPPLPWPTDPPKTVVLPSTSQSERKGTRDFIAMASAVRAQREDARFVATNFSGTESVIGTKLLSRGELLELYGASSIVVTPALWNEPFGLTAVEAMALGRPVVAYDSGGLPEIVEDGVTGFVVPKGRVGELRRAVERLLDDEPQARRMGAAGRLRVEKMFSASSMVDGYLDVLQAAVQTSGESDPD